MKKFLSLCCPYSFPAAATLEQASHNFEFMTHIHTVKKSEAGFKEERQRVQTQRLALQILTVLVCMGLFAANSDEPLLTRLLGVGVVAVLSLVAINTVLPDQHKEGFVPMPFEFHTYSESDIPRMKSFIQTIVKSQYQRAISVGNGLERSELEEKKEDFENKFKNIDVSKEETIQTAKEAFDSLLQKTNNILDSHKTAFRYPINSQDSWQTYSDGLKTIESLLTPTTPTLAPANPKMPPVPVINWSQLKTQLPPVLVTLISDIRQAWSCSSFIDERTQPEVHQKSSTIDRPGAIRCPHLNDEGSLPRLDTSHPTPEHAVALKEHLETYAKVSHAMDSKKKLSYPSEGYVEYTGVGIYNDTHYCKVIFDYKNGHVFVTLTHYQRWRGGDGEIDRGGDRSAFFGVGFGG